MKLMDCNTIVAEIYGQTHTFYAPLSVDIEKAKALLLPIADTAYVRECFRSTIQPTDFYNRLIPGLEARQVEEQSQNSL